MFLSRKPKGWQHLQDDDWAWLRKLNAENAAPYLEQAVAAGNLQCVRYIRDNHTHNNGFLVLQTIKSMELGYRDIAKFLVSSARKPSALLEHGFHYLFPATAAIKDLDLWDYFCTYQKNVTASAGKTTAIDLLKIADRARFDAGVDHVIANNRDKISNMIEDGLGLRDETFAKLAPVQINNVPRALLSRCLAEASHIAQLQKMYILIRAGADVQYDHGLALKNAALSGNKEAVELLTYAGAKPDKTMPDFIAELRKNPNLRTEFVSFFESHISQKMDIASQHRMAQINATEGGRYSLTAKDTLVDTQHLPSGATLTVVFNFTLRQQMIVAESKGQPPSAPTVIGFDKIENAQTLEAASEKFRDLGGDETLIEPARVRRMLKAN